MPDLAFDPADGVDNTRMADVTGLLGFEGWKVDTPDAVRISSNKYVVIDGVFGGQGGIVCEDAVVADRYEYRASVVPVSSSSRFGLLFRCSEEVDPWQLNGDGFEVYLNGWSGSGDTAQANIQVRRRVAGTSSNLYDLSSFLATTTSGFDFGVSVFGSMLAFWTEPYGGGARTVHWEDLDLTKDVAGSSDDFNDASHVRLGINRTSNSEVGTLFEDIKVVEIIIIAGQVQVAASMEVDFVESVEPDQFSPGIQLDELNPRFYRGSSFRRLGG